ncbi:SusC/RagA family TonB-linked outer membrane protein [Mangrovimonas sp. ST2L15]|uniref:SusC/RagA family TonB-linked outer membrane protein n=1 Tax=Mangrovimonas sp. ST2L15 TaxID=1645916 RepID=UPI0009E68DD4|nr:SusC/RagA family TonB-linked outer membrane protein [Mangrovimonas sp. ST2L15]
MKIKLNHVPSGLFGRRLLLLSMRMFIFLFCVTVFGLNGKDSFAQQKITIDDNKSVSVDEVFQIIKQQTDYHFIYPKNLFQDAPKVQLKKGEFFVGDLLNESLKNSNLNYVMGEHNTIQIIKNNYSATAQGIQISGKVTDENGIPLPGVTVLEANTRNGVATDFSGNYTIKVSDVQAVLEFSYVGFTTRKIDISNLNNYSSDNVINVVLKESINSLDEVVLTGYQELSEERTAGSFTQVGASQLEQRPSGTNIIERITGQVAGLNINPRFNNFEIRGRSTILSAFANPLIIVDGFPLAEQQNLESINPEDVESITILKDASASSIWGSRASNGVVVIVTKRGGKNQPLKVDFSSFVKMENKVDLSDLNLMSTSQEMDLDQEFIDKGWTNINGLVGSNSSINDFHMAQIYRNGLSPDGVTWSQNTYNNYMNELRRRNIENDWEKYFIRNAMQKTYNLSLSGGGERNAFFGSLSYTDVEGQTIGDDQERYTMNMRNTFDFNDKIAFTAGMTAVLRQQNDNSFDTQYGAFNPIDMFYMAQPYDQLVDENGQYIQKYYSWNPWMSQDREPLVGAPYTYNYLEEHRNLDNDRTLLDIRADFKLDVEILKDLTLSSSFRYERNTNDYDSFKSMDLPSWRNMVNDFYIYDSNTDSYQYGIPKGSQYLQERTYSKGWVFKNTLNWDKEWGDHQLNVFAGGEYSRRFTEFLRNRQFGYDKESTTYLPINEAALLSYNLVDWTGARLYDFYAAELFDINNQDNRFVSYFSNMGYTFKNKYTLNGSFRIDQANIFGSNPDFRYKPLWSVGVAWDAAKEAFLDNANWINRLKVRATYGLGGNSLIGVYPEPTARVRNITWGNTYNSLVLSQPGNPDLKWEETATTNLGVDFAFFNNRLSGSIDYYIKKSTDVYTSKVIDPTVGWSTARVNYADIDNKGVELQLNADVIRSNDFTWSVRANFNYNKNILAKAKLTNAPTADSYTGGNAYEEGMPIGGLYAYNFAGLDDNGEVLLYDANGNTRSWRGTVDIDELEYVGTTVPQHYGGLSTTFNYKGLDLTVNMNYQADYVFRMSYNYASAGYGSYNNYDYGFGNIRLHQEWANRWMNPGDEAFTDVPKVFYNGLNPMTGEYENRYDTSAMHRIWNQSNRNVHKGDYLRVQDIILGYTMPKKFLDRTFLTNLRLTMQVANPFLWVANDLGVDPIAPNSEAYTNLTSYTFGVRVSF